MKVIKTCKNGSFLVQKDELDVGPLRGGGLLFELCNSIELDFELHGDPGCVGMSMYYPVYNAKTQMLYLVSGEDAQNYEQGKAIWLIGAPYSQSSEEEELYDEA